VRECLQLFWQNEPKKSLSLLSYLLAEKPNHPMKLSLYRLWIEISLVCEDTASLVSLAEHFQLLAAEQSDFSEGFTGLKGICHLALDELEASELMAQSLSKSRDPFALEFLQLLSGVYGTSHFEIGRSETCLTDFFHLRTLCLEVLKKSSSAKILETIFAHGDVLYPNSPLSDLILSFKFVAEGNIEQAKQRLASLARKFPENEQFREFSILIQGLEWNWDAVRENIGQAKFSYELLALAECGSRIGVGNRAAWDQTVRDLYRKLDIDFVAHQRHESQRKPFIAYVGPDQWEQISGGLQSNIELELSHKIFEGDWVFLARRIDTGNTVQSRIFGIFQATWQGGLGLQTLGTRKLETVLLFERSCAVTLQDREGSLPNSFGLPTVYPLEGADLDLIADAMAEQLLYENDLIQDLVHNLSA
jgi:hypothetical protein